jgi:serine/threonine protein kinase
MNPTAFGKYYLLERINVGGMAEVFCAKAFGVEGFERLVAVKRIRPTIAADPEFVRAFIEEAKLAVQLNHANLAQIFDLGVVDGQYYVALEHVQGRDLRRILERCRQSGTPMPLHQACFIAMKVCEGLDHAHNKRDSAGRELGLVHRDLSPQHVLISYDGEVKLIDFGVAKAAVNGHAHSSEIFQGKLGYLSPEQAYAQGSVPTPPTGEVGNIDKRSDVFACGVLLYEMLTGERLFAGESDAATLHKVRNVEILPPSTFNPRISDALERIVLKALARDPADRYPRAIDLHDALGAFVQGSGEVYSRAELSAWMKGVFGREFEDDRGKLEAYRQLAADMVSAPVVAPSVTGSKPATPQEREPTQPIPLEISQLPQRAPDAVFRGHAASTESAITASGSVGSSGASAVYSETGWGSDGLDTQIYDDPGDNATRASRGNRSEGTAAAARSHFPPASVPMDDIGATLQGWEGGPVVTMSPAIASALIASAQPTLPTGPAPNTPIGSGRSVPALGSSPMYPTPPAEAAPAGAHVQKRKRRLPSTVLPYFVVAGGALVLAGVGASVALRAGARTDGAGPSSRGVADPETGFDLYVSPPGVTTWRLDGDVRTDRLPSRIRGIVPGAHQLAIDAPPGFLSQRQTIAIVQGTSPKIEIVLDPITGIKGTFQTTPPGARVWLIIDGKREALGTSPAAAPLDPRKSYQVVFEKAGYVSVNRPIVFSGGMNEKIAVDLERVGAGSAQAATATAAPPAPNPSVTSQSIAAPSPETKQTETSKPAVVAKPKPDVSSGPVPKVPLPQKAEPPTKIAAQSKAEITKPGTVVKAAAPASPASAPKPAVTQSSASAPKPAVTQSSASAAKPAATPSSASVAKPTVAAKPVPAKPEVGTRTPASATRDDIIPKGQGTLFLGSKPPCEIFIDGESTGKYTPQKDLKLSAGKHRITLISPELGLRESFTVDIRPNQVEKVIKDFSDRIQLK